MKKLCYLIFVGFILVGIVGIASAIPQLINYQGFLTDDAGVPVADGDYQLIFSIYNVESGGSALWTETHSAVSVTNGLFNVILGSVDPVGNPLTLPFDTDYWVGVQIGVEPELPRIRLTSVGYSYKADMADYALDADHAVNADHAMYADTADYALAANVAHVDSANVAANAWNWANNPWGIEYPNANIADTANYVAGANVDGEVAQANHAGTADYASNADRVDDYHAGNSSGQVPISNGTTCTNLNADMLDGQHASAFSLTGHTHDDRYYTEAESDARFVNEGQANSIDKTMIVDEPGLDGNYTDTDYTLTSTVSNIRSVTITAPTAGWVIVTGNGAIEHYRPNTTDGSVFARVYLTTTSGGTATTWTFTDLPGSIQSGWWSFPFSTTKWFAVSAGANTFYMTAMEGGGGSGSITTKLCNPFITAIFIGTVY